MTQQSNPPLSGESTDPDAGVQVGTPHSGEAAGEGLAGHAEVATLRREADALREALAAARERERVLADELQHRVRNVLAVIRSIYRRTREIGASQEEFAEHFEGRLGALARYHAHASDEAAGIDLEDMLRDELLEVHCVDGPGCAIEGPPIRLTGKTAELMGLAIHELATNSIKFGALAHDGALTVKWSLDPAGQGSMHFLWVESGVSPISSAPRPSGFGRQLIEGALPYQLGATTSFDMKPGGLECRILLPLAGAGQIPHQFAEAVGGEPRVLPFDMERT